MPVSQLLLVMFSTRLQVEEYVSILNSLDCRVGKKPLEVNNVIYWFKNTRAAVKRALTKTELARSPSYVQEQLYLARALQGGLTTQAAHRGYSRDIMCPPLSSYLDPHTEDTPEQGRDCRCQQVIFEFLDEGSGS